MEKQKDVTDKKNTMKKITFLFLFISGFLFCQNEGYTNYHSDKTYSYPKYEDKELIKLKTENYLRGLKEAGFIIKKNEIQEYKFDIDVSSITDTKDIIKFNVRYMFYDTFYSADLWDPKIYIYKKKTWIDLKKENPDHLALINHIEKIAYKQYQNEINSNF